MRTQSYYRDLFPKQTNGDFDIKDEPLIVNCTGFWERALSDTPTVNEFKNGRNDFYLIYSTDGYMTARLDGEVRDFPRGSFIIYQPHTPYSNISPDGSLSYLWIHFTGFHVRRLLSGLKIEPNRIYHTSGSDEFIAVLNGHFRRMFYEIANRRFGFDGVCSGILCEILAELARDSAADGSRDRRSLNSVAYLHRHFKENTPLEKLASMENLSVSRYRDVFKAQTGFSPTDYRTMLRLQHACELLTQSTATMTEVALECGYTDVYYFLRIFKAKEGMTPGEYRAKARG